ncbi:EAL domain-containing protein [bacterium LRH843]|nr:EAL domain-containing protein [bacterium LRH843]
MNNNAQSLNINEFFSYITFLLKKRKNGMNEILRYYELKKIMKRNALTTYFQPIIELESKKIVGYEALNRPPFSKFFPSTDIFYDYIGSTNQVFLFELFCRNASLREYASNLKDVPGEKEKLLFINIHPDVLIDSKYRPGETIQLLQEFDLKPSQIVFELTERKAVTDFEMFKKVLFNYRSQGFRLAIDDAGTGYNSLKTLVHLRPEFIKLDRSLIHNIIHNEAQQKMVDLLLNFSNQSNTSVIAEGIEHLSDLEYLKQMGIHYGQGYALGKPHPKLFSFQEGSCKLRF